ncbi:MAG: glycogen debranching protein [Candidatus Eisenbacteria bacterium]|uniref:Glycogen debranching protein n=1 Tax=Eiseniibacteriota bacterium TaxID=2212470 RepID=A0A849SNU4_UNCEI|nr:glycogen debranching protein [Candidatus Eisenbacteria bacterium]
MDRRSLEWLEADGLGGFAMGTAAGLRTRRYHAILQVATTPPTGRVTLVNGLEVWADTDHGAIALCTNTYAPEVVHPDGEARLQHFDAEPWPTWRYSVGDDRIVVAELLVPRGERRVALRWTLETASGGRPRGTAAIRLRVRPLMSGRDMHALHHESAAFRFEAEPAVGVVRWRPYESLPEILALTNGTYRHAPEWYRTFVYLEERARGLDHVEDLASPGEFSFDLAGGAAVMVLEAQLDVQPDAQPEAPATTAATAEALVARLRASERRRRRGFATRLHRAADAYLVQRGAGRTVIAGYPWFTDWGRDTFIALRGLCLAGGRLDDAGRILDEWAGEVSEGMLPNRFVEGAEAPEFNSVDASLWYVVAAHEWLLAMRASSRRVPRAQRERLLGAATAILDGYARGTRFGIRLDDDGLIAAGISGVQLTWMDAKVGDWVVTPRIGKPVEIQALWLNALRLAGEHSKRWSERFEHGLASFREQFWSESRGHLADVVDVDHQAGRVDWTFRPNQLFAIGGLPYALIDGDRAQRLLHACEERLWTPLGPRSLAPGEPGYAPRYEGGVLERDAAYHQGTVWPWLTGAFVDAWLRLHPDTDQARAQARERFLVPLLQHLDAAGLGHVSEIADAETPHRPRGCPFQAWSVGEVLRLQARLASADNTLVPRRVR